MAVKSQEKRSNTRSEGVYSLESRRDGEKPSQPEIRPLQRRTGTFGAECLLTLFFRRPGMAGPGIGTAAASAAAASAAAAPLPGHPQDDRCYYQQQNGTYQNLSAVKSKKCQHNTRLLSRTGSIPFTPGPRNGLGYAGWCFPGRDAAPDTACPPEGQWLPHSTPQRPPDR